MTIDDAIKLLTDNGYSVSGPPTKGEVASTAFDTFWASYPRKENKSAARTAFTRALKSADSDNIIDSIRAQVTGGVFSTETKYIPMASTWLNQSRWENPVVARTNTAHGRATIDALTKFMES